MDWPKVSIVTPSYNQAKFIEETIRSVLLQGYPDLEYLVIDGGSTDNSADIIRKYEPWLAYWVSESDRGQSEAINKGFRRASGTFFAWLNSDDVYLRHTLEHVARSFAQDRDAVLAYGRIVQIDQQSRVQGYVGASQSNLRELVCNNFISQPATFMRRDAWLRAGDLNESCHLCMDYDLWLRMALQGELIYINQPLAAFRHHPESKTSTQLMHMKVELVQVAGRFLESSQVPPGLRSERKHLLANARWEAGVMLWFNGKIKEGKQHIEAALDGIPTLSREEMAFQLASAAVQANGPGAVLSIRDFLNDWPTIKSLEHLAEGWTHVLLARECPQDALSFRQLLKGVFSAPTARLFRAVLPLITTKILGVKIQRNIRRLRGRFTHASVGVSLSELSESR